MNGSRLQPARRIRLCENPHKKSQYSNARAVKVNLEVMLKRVMFFGLYS